MTYQSQHYCPSNDQILHHFMKILPNLKVSNFFIEPANQKCCYKGNPSNVICYLLPITKLKLALNYPSIYQYKLYVESFLCAKYFSIVITVYEIPDLQILCTIESLPSLNIDDFGFTKAFIKLILLYMWSSNLAAL